MMPAMIGRGSIFFFVGAALMLAHHPARAADEPVRLNPSSGWQLEYADDSCRLARQFGGGDQPSLVVIERFQPGDALTLTVTGPFGAVRSGKDATVRFGPAEGEQDKSFMEGEWAGTPALIFSGMRIASYTEQEKEAREQLKESGQLSAYEPDPIAPERERAVTFLSVDAAGAPEVVFETGSLGEPFAALRRCMDELLTHWGIDAERHKRLTRKALPADSPGTWLRNTDYPTSLLRRGAQGIVHFRLSVDARGKVSDCHIQRSTRPEGFDEAVCEVLMRRARFKPALDAEGKPMASYYINTVRFIIP